MTFESILGVYQTIICSIMLNSISILDIDIKVEVSLVVLRINTSTLVNYLIIFTFILLVSVLGCVTVFRNKNVFNIDYISIILYRVYPCTLRVQHHRPPPPNYTITVAATKKMY